MSEGGGVGQKGGAAIAVSTWPALGRGFTFIATSAALHVGVILAFPSAPRATSPRVRAPAYVEVVEFTEEAPPPAVAPPSAPRPRPDARPKPPARAARASQSTSRERVYDPAAQRLERLTLSAPVSGPSLILGERLTIGEHAPRIADTSHARFVRAPAASTATPPFGDAPDAGRTGGEPMAVDRDAGAEAEDAGLDAAAPADLAPPSLRPREYAFHVALSDARDEGDWPGLALDLSFLGLDRREALALAFTRRDTRRLTGVRTDLDGEQLEARIIGAATSRGAEVHFVDDGESRVALLSEPPTELRIDGGDVLFGQDSEGQRETTRSLLEPRADAVTVRVVPVDHPRGTLVLRLAARDAREVNVELAGAPTAHGDTLARLAEAALGLEALDLECREVQADAGGAHCVAALREGLEASLAAAMATR